MFWLPAKKMVSMAMFFFFFSSLAFVYAIQEDSWVLKKSQEGIKVYSRKLAESPILEFRSEMIVDAPLEKTVGLFEHK